MTSSAPLEPLASAQEPGAATGSADWVTRLELASRDFDEGVASEAFRFLDGHPDADPAIRERLRLAQALVDSSRGRIEAGAAALHEVQAWAVQHDHPYLRARCELVLSVLLRRAGEVATALEHAVAAVELLPDDVHPALRADHLVGLADSLALCRSWDDALMRYHEAVPLAVRGQESRVHLRAVNNLAYTLYEAERYQEAARFCEDIIATAEAASTDLPLYALDTLALTYIAVGRLEEAETVLAAVGVDADTAPDDVAQTMLTLASVRRQRGDLTGAEEALSRSRDVAEDHHLGGIAVQGWRERAELSAAQGRFDAAFAEFKEYHERLLAQHAVERDARARMLHAIFEAAEARRESERFRELSYRDALTKLSNRRYVDEHLSPLIQSSVARGQHVSVAFIDLDHFKRINDSCSHEVGDEVLRRVAAVLDTYAGWCPGGIAARMGGEEFLLVLPGIDRDASAPLLDDLRADVERIDWDGLTGNLPVTVSIGGAACSTDGAERLTLLASADRRLYVAKNTGRNRVVCGD